MSQADEFRAGLGDEEQELLAAGRRAGRGATHGPSIGHAREELIRTKLRRYSRGCEVTRGQIAGPNGYLSGEWDVIVYDSREGSLLPGDQVPLHAVKAVLSIKSKVTTADILECWRATLDLRSQPDASGGQPLVVLCGFDGVTERTVRAAVRKARIEVGDAGTPNLIAVLGALLTPPASDPLTFQYEEVWASIVVAFEAAAGRPTMASIGIGAYLSDEPSNERAEAEGAPADRLLLAGRTEAGLAVSRLVGRVRSELAVRAPEALERFDVSTANAQRLVAALPSAQGPLLEALGEIAVAITPTAGAGLRALERAVTSSGPERRPELVAICVDALAAADDNFDAAGYLKRSGVSLQLPVAQLLLVEPEGDPQRALAELEQIHPSNALERYRLALARAEAHLADGDLTLLEREAAKALAIRWSPKAALLLAAPVLRAPERDREALHAAIGLYAEVGVELVARSASDAALAIDSEFVALLAAAGREADLDALCRWWMASGLLADAEPERVAGFGLALAAVGEIQLARAVANFFAPTSTPAAALLGLVLSALDSDGGPDGLDQFLKRDDVPDPTRAVAATLRLVLADTQSWEWSAEAESVVQRIDPDRVTRLRAVWLASRGSRKEAETLLLPQANSSAGRDALIAVAAAAEDWEAVVRRHESVGTADDDRRALLLAAALVNAGRVSDAEQIWRRLSRSANDPHVRETASFRLARSLTKREQWRELADFGREWNANSPDSPVALWVAVDALARTGNPEDAYVLWAVDGRGPSSEGERRLLAHVATSGLPLPAALEVVAGLSDSVGRTDEVLESLLITASAGRDKESLPPALEARVRQTFADFTERFPESKIVYSAPAPTDEQEWEQFVADHLRGRAEVASRALNQVEDGDCPLGVLADLAGSVMEAWLMSPVLPLTDAVPDTLLAELDAADAGIADSVVWDASALVVIGRLPRSIEATVVAALPGSHIPRRAAAEAAALLDKPESAGVLYSTPDGPRYQAPDTDDAEIRTRVAALAAALSVDDPDYGGVGALAKALHTDALDDRVEAWIAAARLAESRQVPLFCDDRWLRRMCREHGIACFGTVALVGALAGRGLLSDEEVDRAVWDLRIAGGSHLPVEEGELAAWVDEEVGRSEPWADAARATAGDRGYWLADRDHLVREWAHLLFVKFESPEAEELELWLRAFLNSGARQLDALGVDDPAAGALAALFAAVLRPQSWFGRVHLTNFASGDRVRAFVVALFDCADRLDVDIDGQAQQVLTGVALVDGPDGLEVSEDSLTVALALMPEARVERWARLEEND